MTAMPAPYQTELQVAIAAVIDAAHVCRSVQRQMGADSLAKKDQSPVTVADFASQALICHQIHQTFPNDPIVGEEDARDLRDPGQAEFVERLLKEIHLAGKPDCTTNQLLDWIDSGNHDATGSRYWTLDPIDGTKGFLRKEQFAISLALLIDHQIQVAALACPNLPFQQSTGAVYFAVKGQGAFAIPIDEPGAEPIRVQVSAVADPASARLCESVESGHSSHGESASIQQQLGMQGEPVRMDSQAKYAAVASGTAEVYLRLPTRPGYEEKIWDHAGGVLVLEEAGGKVTDINGSPLDFAQGSTLKSNRGVVASNSLLHEKVIAALQSR